MQQSFLLDFGPIRATPVTRRSFVNASSKSFSQSVLPSRLLENLSESFDEAQDERRGFDIVDDFPFMLRFLEAFLIFFSNLLGHSQEHCDESENSDQDQYD